MTTMGIKCVSNLNQDEYLDDDYYEFIIQLTKFVCLAIN
jgi:hypothetical protein